MNKAAEPVDIANTVLFLASDNSNHITGETILSLRNVMINENIHSSKDFHLELKKYIEMAFSAGASSSHLDALSIVDIMSVLFSQK